MIIAGYLDGVRTAVRPVTRRGDGLAPSFEPVTYASRLSGCMVQGITVTAGIAAACRTALV
ncbi:hypothetical protein AB0H83_45580 [Dactylosporangium sp. NPDC050688]|uniref:hypothetical protein n=1 Tax=Dactylosporangium sp. NPDC050688 TaxID=3157217 RepID=UPI0033E9CFA1